MASLDSGIDQASGCRLAFQDHARVMSLDSDAYRGSKGVMGCAVRVFRLRVGAVGTPAALHILYLSHLCAKV